MPSTITLMVQLMSDCGRLIISTGDSAVKVRRLVILKSTSNVLLISTNGEETLSNYGIPTQHVDADIKDSKINCLCILHILFPLNLFMSEFHFMVFIKKALYI